jgi:hypothetical protein
MEMENLAARNQRLASTQNKAYFDAVACLRSENQAIQVGNLVFVFRPFILLPIKSRDTKLDERWQGPYCVKEKPQDSTYYLLEELDGTPMKHKCAGDQVKKYYPRLLPERPPINQQVPVDSNIEDNSTSSSLDSAPPILVVPPGGHLASLGVASLP